MLKSEPVSLCEFYHNNIFVRGCDIKKQFSISSVTACKVVSEIKKYITDNDLVPAYHPKTIPVATLFLVYGWDIKQIEKSAKVIININHMKGD